jgi:hypothetical protein
MRTRSWPPARASPCSLSRWRSASAPGPSAGVAGEHTAGRSPAPWSPILGVQAFVRAVAPVTRQSPRTPRRAKMSAWPDRSRPSDETEASDYVMMSGTRNALTLLSGKWSVEVLYLLASGTRRYTGALYEVGEVSKKTLTHTPLARARWFHHEARVRRGAATGRVLAHAAGLEPDLPAHGALRMGRQEPRGSRAPTASGRRPRRAGHHRRAPSRPTAGSLNSPSASPRHPGPAPSVLPEGAGG